ncbi:hypothetical protein [Geothrix sp. 21YS21S-4]|uniref:hypothetical protein n=1 Tax=Geothrix sp. 21YS21S-4 TaxID=3068889 RepID=UPI0027BA30EA|nr:hypothetical protein [Geothrix sp. 21YS21S-4]
MNLKLEALNLVRWLHFVALAVGGGAGVVALLLSGFEEGRGELRGLAAAVWSKVAAWGFRVALIAGIGLLFLKLQGGQNPFKNGTYFHIKLLLVFILVGMAEMAPKALAVGKRGAALLALVLFLAASFVAFNKGLFGARPAPAPEMPLAAGATLSAR